MQGCCAGSVGAESERGTMVTSRLTYPIYCVILRFSSLRRTFVRLVPLNLDALYLKYVNLLVS